MVLILLAMSLFISDPLATCVVAGVASCMQSMDSLQTEIILSPSRSETALNALPLLLYKLVVVINQLGRRAANA